MIIATMVNDRLPSTHLLTVYWCAVGLLMGAAFLHAALWWSGVLGLALVLWLMRTGTYSGARLFWLGFLAGTAKAALVISWFWSAYPLDWIGVSDRTLQLVTVGIVWITVSASIGLGFGFFSVVASRALKRSRWIQYLAIPFILIISELFGSLIFSIYSLGPESTPNVHFSFGYFGYTIANHGILSLFAFLGGVYALSLIVGLMGTLLSDHALSKQQSIAVLVLVGALYFVPQTFLTSEPSHSIAAINTSFPLHGTVSSDERLARSAVLREAFTAALVSKSDIVVFPETAHGLASLSSSTAVFDFVTEIGDARPIIVDSIEVVNGEGSSVVAADMYDTATEKTYRAYKNYLVPSGEFLPYNMVRAMRLLGFKDVVAALEQKMRLTTNVPEVETKVPGNIPGVLFCSESVSPLGTIKAMRNMDVPLIVHPVSHSWFHDPEVLWYQLDLMLRAQVRFAGVPLVQASNMSPPRAYDANGLPVIGTPVFINEHSIVVVYEL